MGGDLELLAEKAKLWPRGTRVRIEHDGFVGVVIGWYETLEGKSGVVLQLDNSRIVHVYGERWLIREQADA